MPSPPWRTAGGDATLGPVPFEGPHQAGILTPAPPAAAFLALDVIAEDRGTLAELLRTITARARYLTAGGVPPALGVQSPPSDSGTLGPDVPPDALTVTLGVSTILFDDRFGLAAQKPIRLTTMQPFPNDGLDPAWLGGDLILQLCAGSTDTVLHALRDIAKHTRGAMQVRWRMDGFISPPRPSGVPRNHLGFMDGIANPDVQKPQVADQLLWVVKGHGEPAWAVGGSYHVIRLIRMFTEFWDRVSMHEQQTMIGRYRDSGAPLGMTSFTDIPDYKKDPYGYDVPLTAHMRLANPRTDRTEPSRILRRGYNYDLGTRRERHPQHGSHLQLLPTGHPPPVRGHPDPAHRRTVGRLHQALRGRVFLRPAWCPQRPRLVGTGTPADVTAAILSPECTEHRSSCWRVLRARGSRPWPV